MQLNLNSEVGHLNADEKGNRNQKLYLLGDNLVIIHILD